MVVTNQVLDELLSHGGWLRELACSLIQDSAAADDVVQETYLAALRSPPSIDRPVRPFLGFVLRNAVRKHHRRERRREHRERLRPEPPESFTSDEILERAEMQKVLAEEVLALRDPYRTAIVLRYFEQKSQIEIARMQGLEESTVRTHLERGRAQLRERLDRRFGDRQAWCLPLLRLAQPATATIFSKTAVLAWAIVLLAGTMVSAWVLPDRGAPAPSHETAAVEPSLSPAEEAPADAGVEATRTAVSEPSRPEPTAPLRVSGRVVFSEDGAAAAGSEITVLKRSGPESGLSGTAWTDERGFFRAELAPMDAAEYAASWLGRYSAPLQDALVARSSGHARLFRFPVTDSRSSLDAPSGESVLPEPLVVHRGLRVAGRVRSKDGRTVAGAKLFLLTEGQRTLELPAEIAWGVGATASDGSFSLAEPVTVQASTDARRLILAAVSQEGLGWIRLNPLEGQGAQEVQIVIDRTSLRFLVRDDQGRPLADARIRLLPPFGPTAQIDEFVPLELLSASTGGGGVGLLDRVPMSGGEQVYQALVEHDDCEPRQVSFTLSGEDQQQVEVSLSRLRSVFLGGHVIDSRGAPVPNAQVVLIGVREVSTDEHGLFRTEIRTGSNASIPLEVRAGGFAVAHETVAVPEDGGDLQVDLRLERVLPTSLCLVDLQGRPVEGLFPQLKGGGETKAATAVGPGRFLFADTTAGSFTVRFTALPGRLSDWVLPLDLKVQGGDTGAEVVLLRASPGRSDVAVELIDADSGEPLDADSICCQGLILTELGQLSGEERPWRFIKREAGRLRGEMPPGEWTFWARVPGRPLSGLQVEVKPGERTRRATLRIGRGATITGRVEGLDLTAEGSVISIEPADLSHPPIHWAGADPWRCDHQDPPVGSDFCFDNLPVGRFRLKVSSEGNVVIEQLVEMPATSEVRLLLRPATAQRSDRR